MPVWRVRALDKLAFRNDTLGGDSLVLNLS